MTKEQREFEEQAAKALGVSVHHLRRMQAQHQRFMRELTEREYLESPRTWGTVDTAIEQVLARKRKERMHP